VIWHGLVFLKVAPRQVWFSVAYMVQRPVRPTYVPLQRLPEEDRADLLGVSPPMTNGASQGTVKGCTMWRGFRSLPLERPMKVEWYFLAADLDRKLAKLRPWRQRVRAVGSPIQAIWEGAQRELEHLRQEDARRARRAEARGRGRARGGQALGRRGRGGRRGPRGPGDDIAEEPADAMPEAGEGIEGMLEDGEELLAEGGDDLDEVGMAFAEEGAAESGDEQGDEFVSDDGEDDSLSDWDIGDADLQGLFAPSGPEEEPDNGEGGHEPPVPPPPPPAPPPAARDSQAGRAAPIEFGEVISFDVGAGQFIKYYAKSETFTAECSRADHRVGKHKYVLTRQARASDVPSRRGQGRPLALLWAWLHDCPANSDRFEHVHVFPFSCSLASRQGYRNMLVAHGSPIVQAMLGRERPQREGESLEPADIS